MIFQACLECDILPPTITAPPPIVSIPDFNAEYDIQDLCYNHIEGDFFRAKYDDFKIIIMMSCGYVNATNLCDMISFKSYHTWLQNVSTKNLIAEFIHQSGVTEWCKVIKLKSKELNGTYIHPDLINSVITWAAPSFAL